jgi:hypothetical protein
MDVNQYVNKGENHMEIFARQGDLVIEKLPDGALDGVELIKRNDVVFAGDSSGHRHRLLGIAFVAQDSNTRRTRIRIAEPVELVHEKADGHKSASMSPGDYEVRPLRERGDGNDRVVED